LKNTIKGLIKLTRFDEYVYFVIITTLLGVASARGSFDWRMLILIPANWLAVGFAFMINDIEDAPDDALTTQKINRNPVSAGLISPKIAKIATFLTAIISIILFGLLGLWPLIFGLITLALGYLYSYRGVRLKTMPIFDIISHCLMLAGLQFLVAYFTYSPRLGQNWFWPFTFVVSISVYGELYNEIRDIDGDRSANLHHTAIFLGERSTHILMLVMLFLGIFSGAVSLIMIELIPLWVFFMMAFLVVLFLLPQLLKINREDGGIALQGKFHKPVERAAALALLLQYVIPWLREFLNLNPF